MSLEALRRKVLFHNSIDVWIARARTPDGGGTTRRGTAPLSASCARAAWS